jgi:hypothetical protein
LYLKMGPLVIVLLGIGGFIVLSMTVALLSHWRAVRGFRDKVYVELDKQDRVWFRKLSMDKPGDLHRHAHTLYPRVRSRVTDEIVAGEIVVKCSIARVRRDWEGLEGDLDLGRDGKSPIVLSEGEMELASEWGKEISLELKGSSAFRSQLGYELPGDLESPSKDEL